MRYGGGGICRKPTREEKWLMGDEKGIELNGIMWAPIPTAGKTMARELGAFVIRALACAGATHVMANVWAPLPWSIFETLAGFTACWVITSSCMRNRS